MDSSVLIFRLPGRIRLSLYFLCTQDDLEDPDFNFAEIDKHWDRPTPYGEE